MCAGGVEIKIEGGLLEPGVDHPRHVDTHHCKGISGDRGRRERDKGEEPEGSSVSLLVLWVVRV